MATTPDIAFERGLPASIDAERSILGAILLENTAYNEATERITADDFASIRTSASSRAWASSSTPVALSTSSL